ncbi:calcium-binding protein [Methylorubrum salsuginis]|uniref:Ca2+-binding protein, RTX toxin-related n=1 Tax=Methylorubrum salsuginis TaxID=414703 RepID=A0A1I4CAV6_9HYPH|nr:calcium-binding protein [Methylorubrum salsuginis]SFK78272.1 Ca2+-binding protein, RTX toxin-related [Methylorubrum salsuginis]
MSTFTITSATDILVGDAQDDLFVVDGSLTKLSDADRIDGGGGNDTLTIRYDTIRLAASRLAGLTSIEALDLTAGTADTTVELDARSVGQADGDQLELRFGGNTMLLDVSTVGAAGKVVLNGTGLVTLRGYEGQVVTVADGVNGNVAGAGGGDVIRGGSGNDRLSGGDGADTLSGGAGIDTLSGGAGTDLIILGAGDQATGGADADLFVVQAGGTATISDFDAVSRVERIDLRAFETVRGMADLTLQDVPGGVSVGIAGTTLMLQNITQSQLSAADFLFFGQTPPQAFYLTSGVDAFQGGDGDDQFIVDGTATKLASTDRMNGGNGTDTLTFLVPSLNVNSDRFDGATSIEAVDMTAATQSLIVGLDAHAVSQSSTDVLELQYGGNAMLLDVSTVGAAGKVVLNGTGLVTLRGYEGQVVTVADGVNGNVQGAEAADTITGGSGADRLAGDGGRDTISGGRGNDILKGEDGDDVLDGGAGRDTIVGGAGFDRIVLGAGGADTVTGGTEGDTYVLTAGGSATITDFELDALLERIDLRAFSDVHSMADMTLTDTSAGVLIAVGNASLTLKGIAKAQLSENKFIYIDSDPTVFKVAAGTSVEVVQALIDGAGAGVTIELAAGDYYWDHRLTITDDNVTLKGAGAGKTVIHSTIKSAEAESAILAYAKGERTAVGTFTASTAIDATTIKVTSTGGIKVGDVVYVSQLNDKAYIAETGNQEWARVHGAEAYQDKLTLREALVRVTAISGNEVTLSHKLPYAFAAGKATLSTLPMLSGLDIGGFTVRTDGAAPDPHYFDNVDNNWLSVPTIEFRGVQDSQFNDVSVINSHSVPIKFQTTFNMSGSGFLVDGAYNKLGGDGYGFYLQESFANTFKDVTTLNVRHGVITSAASAEHYNTIEVTYTNRDVNFHGGPDSRNTILVKEMVLEYGPSGEQQWRAVSPGSPPEHPKSTIDANDVRFVRMTGGDRPDTVYGADGNAYLNGMDGNDILYGGRGNDTIIGGFASDLLSGGDGNDTIQGDSGVDTVLGGLGNDQISGGTENDILSGEGGNDRITGDAGDDTLNGGSGADILTGGLGSDRISTGAGSDRIERSFGEGNDIITDFTAGVGGDVLALNGLAIKSFAQLKLIQVNGGTILDLGNDGKITLSGVTAKALTTANFAFGTIGKATAILGGSGFSRIVGTDGNDTIELSRTYLSNKTPIYGGAGFDVVKLSGNVALDAATFDLRGVEALDLTAASTVRVVMNDTQIRQADTGVFGLRVGTKGEMILDAGIAAAGLTLAVEGTRLVKLTSNRDQTLTMTSTVGSQLLGGAKTDTVLGGAGADRFDGAGGNDVLSGGAGRDTLIGGLGDDNLVGGPAGDTLDGGDGLDFASYASSRTGVVASLANGTANTGDAAGDTYRSIEGLRGSAFNDTLRGDAGANVLMGGAGADRLEGGRGIDTASYAEAALGVVANLARPIGNTGEAAGDTYSSIENLIGSQFDDRLTGTAGDNLIDGQAGRNILAGGGGNDTFIGGIGTDRYVGGAGSDTVTYASATSGIVVSLSAPAGNTGLAKGDTFETVENLVGTAFADSLTGDAGNNVLDGGLGSDKLNGGLGDDTYYLDVATDSVTDSGGIDHVLVSFSYSLAGTSIENLTLLGLGNFSATGNASANTITGNAGANRIDGGVGADKMTGGLGDDVYWVDNTGDRVVEARNGGTDAVISKVSFSLDGTYIENLTLDGTANIDAVGSAAANIIRGNAGSNDIRGGRGADTLYAGNDNVTDIFHYVSAGDSGPSLAAADHILQFDVALTASYTKSDKIDLSAMDAGTAAGDQAFRYVNEFVSARSGQAQGQIMVKAVGTDAHVMIDIDGNKTTDMLIIVENTPSLTAWDFIL